MARQQAERSEKRRRQDARRAELVTELGSLDAVIEPCARERLLLKATKPWRQACKRPFQRWTAKIAGYGLYDEEKAPAEVLAAIDAAYPMPTTYADAKLEEVYWGRRNHDMDLALFGNCGDYGLDQVAVWRWNRVRKLVEHNMPLHTLPEIIDRLKVYRSSDGGTDTVVEDAILRDLEALAMREGQA